MSAARGARPAPGRVRRATGTRKASPKRRAADLAYEVIEELIATLQLAPGQPVVEAEIIGRTGLTRTPLREALLRMTSTGLIEPQPRRGLRVSEIDRVGHLDVIATRRALERVIAACAARRASDTERADVLARAQQMVRAGERGQLAGYMRADHELDAAIHRACRNPPAVQAVAPLALRCRRFWAAYRHEGDLARAAQAHLALAQGIASGDERQATAAADALMDHLEQFARRVIEK